MIPSSKRLIFSIGASAVLIAGCASSDGASTTTAAAAAGSAAVATTQPDGGDTAATDAGGEATTSDASESAGGDVGTRENPVPIGQAADVGDGWTMTINSVNLNANDVIASANEFNQPPPDGFVYVLINLTAAYNGEGSATGGVSVGALGEGTNKVSDLGTAQNFPVAPEPVLDQFAEVFSGGTTEGNIVLEVPTSDIDTLVLSGQAFASFSENDRKFFAAR